MTYDSAVSLFNEITIGRRTPCSLRMEIDGVFILTIPLAGMNSEQAKSLIKMIDFRELQYVSVANLVLEVY